MAVALAYRTRLNRLPCQAPSWISEDRKGADTNDSPHSVGSDAHQRRKHADGDARSYQHQFACVPVGQAPTQNNLGNALLRLAERESGMARLEEAVAAYRAALEEMTRERVPLDWATTQNNLGNALLPLAERESGTARLEEVVAAYRAALEEMTRERVPLDWATTQNNLGNALLRLDERESGTARLEEAVAAYRAALEERTRERAPLQWALTQNNLGNALWAIGAREAVTTRLEEAIATYDNALEVLRMAGADHYGEVVRANREAVLRRDHDTAANLRFGRTQAFTTWADVTGVAMAA
jgi:tetratricopeptide (TPR) repeat protein